MPIDTPSRRAMLAGTVVAVGGGAFYLARSGSDDHDDLSPTFHSSEETTAMEIDLSGRPIMGSADAALDLYYWTDYQCPFCEQFERETLPDLVRKYVDAGEMRVVFVTLPFFGEDSMTTAVASKCVWSQVRDDDPEAFWNWHTMVYEHQGQKNSGWASESNLLSYTESVDGVDADALETCLDDRWETFESDVSADSEQAGEYGISGTPSFVVYDKESEGAVGLTGAQPIEQFEKAIDRARNG